MSSRWIWLMVGVVVAIVAVVAVGILYMVVSGPYHWYPYQVHGFTGAPQYGPFGVGSGYGYSIYSINESMKLAMDVPSYAHIYPSNNTIVFTSNQINLVVLAMMGNDAESMFNATAPSYAHGDVFVIYGLINPTLVVPSGAVIHVTFINLDDDMYHNFVVTTVPPPYPYYVMHYVGMYGGMGPMMMLYMTWLPPANYKAGYAYGYQYTIVLNEPGTYWYICTYPGHAEEGMYGEIIVSNGVNAYSTQLQLNAQSYLSNGMGMMGWWG